MRTTKKLYQWDTDQKLINCVGKYVDYPIDGGVYRIDVIDKECIIPDELLQVSGTVKVYECMEYGTVKAFAFYINPRPKPPDYVFTPTERLTFEGLVKKVDETIADLQKRADSGEFNGSDYVITESDYDAIAAKSADKLQPTIGELARTLETEKTDREQADISLQKEISGKLSEPVEGLAVGKYFRVAQIDENGHAVLEAVDAKSIGVQDVQVNGESIVADENGVADVPLATNTKLGLVTSAGSNYGIDISGGLASLNLAAQDEIYARTTRNVISPQNIDYAVKAAMCDGKGAEWTAEEQATARERIGIPGDYELIEKIDITEESVLIRDVEPDGTPYNFVSVLIIGTAQTIDERYIVIKANNWWMVSFTFYANKKNYFAAKIYIERGRLFSMSVSGATTDATTDLKTRNQNGLGRFDATAISRIETYNKQFPVGSEIKIYGVRA